MKQKTVKDRIIMVYDGKPASINAGSKPVYQKRIASCYDRLYNGCLKQDKLYAIVYHFYREERNLDADNLSKPLWDALRKKAFDDDYQIKIRCAASINLAKEAVILDETIPEDVFYELSDGIYNHDHTLYIELGELKSLENIFHQSEIWK